MVKGRCHMMDFLHLSGLKLALELPNNCKKAKILFFSTNMYPCMALIMFWFSEISMKKIKKVNATITVMDMFFVSCTYHWHLKNPKNLFLIFKENYSQHCSQNWCVESFCRYVTHYVAFNITFSIKCTERYKSIKKRHKIIQ